jgi:serine/threonine protein kinase
MSDMERYMLGEYALSGRLTSQNSGFSVWGYGEKEGKEYFIKQFLSPKYPEDDNISSPARLKRRMKICEDFEYKKRRLYQTLNRCSDGNAVRVYEFFRVGANYYISTEKIETPAWEIGQVTRLRLADRRRLCAIIAHSVACFHEGGLVHADLKHTNILFTHGKDGIMTAKIIDFDSSFLETAPPHPDEEIVGDQVYFSPEACMHIWGEDVALTCKMDVFALGVLFHRYLAGALPDFDREAFNYAGEAAANGCPVTAAKSLEPELRELLDRMLKADPEERPEAAEVFETLYAGGGDGRFVGSEDALIYRMPNPGSGSSTTSGRFKPAGDL